MRGMRWASALVMSMMLLGVLAARADSHPPEAGQGIVQPIALVPVEQRTTGDHSFIRYFAVAAVTGTAEGIAVCDLLEKTDLGTADHNVHGTCTFQGRFAGSEPGGVQLDIRGTCEGGPLGTCDERFNALPSTGTGGLATLQMADGRLITPVHVTHSLIEYTIRTHFEH